jgi:hypothetical protein
VSNIWIVDNGTDKVYQYTAAASRTSGSQNAAVTFALASGDTNPQGIAEPPPAGTLVASLTALPVQKPLSVTGSSGRPSALAIDPALAGRDAVFAIMDPEFLLGSGEPAIDVTTHGAVASLGERPAPVTAVGLTVTGVAGGQKPAESVAPLMSGGSHAVRSGGVDMDVMDSIFAELVEELRS